MSGLEITYLAILVVCVLSSGFFSGSETALMAIPRERVHQLAARGGAARYLEDLSADPDWLLSTVLIANNFVNILGAAVATTLFLDLLGEDWGPWVATLVTTTVILVIGEITPKTLAARHPDQYALVVAPVIWALGRLLRPVSRVLVVIGRFILRVVGASPSGGPAVTEDDIRAMAALGEQEGEIEAAEREIIESLFHLADRAVREVMTPRMDIRALELPLDLKEIRSRVSATGHSRYPVVREDLDDLAGVLYVKDLWKLHDRQATPERLEALLRPPHYVPESKPILSVLMEMRSRRFGFAVVLDEHGGVEGIVTVKDLMAELVGEIQDEDDPTVPQIVSGGHGIWFADGRVPVEELEDAIGREVPRGAYSTVGGLYLDQAGHIPDRGESITMGNLEMTVIRMNRNRIDRLRIGLVEQTDRAVP